METNIWKDKGKVGLSIVDRLRVNVGIEGAGAPQTTISSAGGESLVADPNRVLKGLVAGPGVMLTPGPSTVTLTAVAGGAGTTIQDEVAPPITGQSVIGPSSTVLDHYFKGVAGGTGIATSTVGSDVVVAQTNTGVVAGSYVRTNLTVNAQGRITAAADGSSDDVVLANAGGVGASLVVDGVGPALSVRSVEGGTGLTAVQNATDVTVNLDNTAVVPGAYTRANVTVNAQGQITAAANGSSTDVTLADSNAGAPGASLVVDGAGPSLTVRKVEGGTALTAVQNADDVTVNLDDTAVTPGAYTRAAITVDQQGRITAAANGSSTDVTLADSNGAAPGASLVVDGAGPALTVRRVEGGVALTATQNVDDVTLRLDDTAVTPGSYTRAAITVDQQGRITAAATGSSEDVTLANAGGVGASLVVDGAGPSLSVRSVEGGTGLTAVQNATDVTVNLDNTAVTPGSYTRAAITVDQQGRITAAADGSSSDVTLTDTGSGSSLITDGTGPSLAVRKLIGGLGVLSAQNANDVTLSQNTAYHYVYHATTQNVAASTSNQTIIYDTDYLSLNSTAVLASGTVAPSITGVYDIAFTCNAHVSVATTGTFHFRIIINGVQVWDHLHILEVSGSSIADRTMAPSIFPETIGAGQTVLVKVDNNMGQQLVLFQPVLTIRLVRQTS